MFRALLCPSSCFSLQPGHYFSLTAPNLKHTANQERNDQCGNQHYSRELLIMGIVMSETCWAYKKCNQIISGIQLVFYSSVIMIYALLFPFLSWLISLYMCGSLFCLCYPPLYIKENDQVIIYCELASFLTQVINLYRYGNHQDHQLCNFVSTFKCKNCWIFKE